jgi:nucleoside-diphosphate-sugar epimerase
MKVLVTGATGFIGQGLCPVLRSRGFEVRAAVRGDMAAVSPGIESIQIGALGPATDWTSAMADRDAVVHLAGLAHVLGARDGDEAARIRAVNVDGTEQLARVAVRCGVRRFVFISSAKVHGERSADRTWTEQDAPGPQDPYSRSKWEAEQALVRVARSTALETTILRPPLVYGLGVKANFLRLLKTVDRGLPIPLGAIRNRRSLVYVGNLVDAIASSLRHPAAANRTFLISDGADVSTPQLIRCVAAALGRPARLVNVPVWMLGLAASVLGRRVDFDRLAGNFAVDVSAFCHALGWTPPHTFEQGIRATAEWYLRESGRQRG